MLAPHRDGGRSWGCSIEFDHLTREIKTRYKPVHGSWAKVNDDEMIAGGLWDLPIQGFKSGAVTSKPHAQVSARTLKYGVQVLLNTVVAW